jgi:hypothetical protein
MNVALLPRFGGIYEALRLDLIWCAFVWLFPVPHPKQWEMGWTGDGHDKQKKTFTVLTLNERHGADLLLRNGSKEMSSFLSYLFCFLSFFFFLLIMFYLAMNNNVPHGLL